jgi:RimJ/RimL family protein N-acetyltransferase
VTGIGVIETERLRLRPLTMDDVDLMVELNRDPDVMRYITGGSAPSRADVEDLVAKVLGTRWIAFTRADDAFVGWFGLRVYDDEPGARELGYRLRRDQWGKGYATEGARALLRVGFADPTVERIWAGTMVVNKGSQRVMQKIGLRYLRTFHAEYDEYVAGAEEGDVEYELRRVDAGDYLS